MQSVAMDAILRTPAVKSPRKQDEASRHDKLHQQTRLNQCMSRLSIDFAQRLVSRVACAPAVKCFDDD